MPDRILRYGLFTSEAWLSLKNNDDRVCWLTLFANADVLGNQPAGPHRLVHMWRYAGIDNPEKAAKVLLELADVDLVRTYQVDVKPYVHIPRYKQYLRHLGKVSPLSPWNTTEEKQWVVLKTSDVHQRPLVDHQRPSPDVDVEVDVNLKQVVVTPTSTRRRATLTPRLEKDQNLEPIWDRSEQATEAKAREYGCWPPPPGENWDQFRARVREAIARRVQGRT